MPIESAANTSRSNAPLVDGTTVEELLGEELGLELVDSTWSNNGNSRCVKLSNRGAMLKKLGSKTGAIGLFGSLVSLTPM